jgi:hypothetical protein
MQHKAAPGFHRPAKMHGHLLDRQVDGAFWAADLDIELLQQPGKGDVRRALVNDDAHRPIGGVRAHIDHRAGETRVHHCRHGKEKLAIEITIAFLCVAV